MLSLKWVMFAVALLVAVWVAVALLGHWTWSKATEELERGLLAARRAPATARFDPAELEGLPAPVQRYFRTSLTAGQRIVTAATIEHTGEFNMGDAQEHWKPFTSQQRVVATRPGFVWNARIAFVPGLAVRVHDAYVAGAGHLRAAVEGLWTVTELRNTPDLAEGELMRFFAEAAWLPTALLPSQGVRWVGVDARTARATLDDGGLACTLTFRFDDAGLVGSVSADARGRTVGGRIEPTPWEGRWSNWQWRDGMRVPLDGEVAWLPAAGRRPYWRGSIASIAYRFAD